MRNLAPAKSDSDPRQGTHPVDRGAGVTVLRNSRLMQVGRVIDPIGFFPCRSFVHKGGMIYGYARVSTDGQTAAAQVATLTAAGAAKVFREVASGAKTDRTQLRRALDQLEAGDVLMVTRLDRLARSTRDLLNTLATIAERKAGFRSLVDTWADTTRRTGG